jgi:hypothetical protein
LEESSETIEVLLVEDNPDDAELLTRSISGCADKKFEVIWVASFNAVQLGTINFDSGWSTRDRFEELDRQSISTIFV